MWLISSASHKKKKKKKQIRLKLKKVGKTTRPASYDLNQIPFEYAVEVMNRFKGLDIVNLVPEEIWT